MEVEDARYCALASSGLMACTIPFLAFASAGSHALVGDNVYGPTRRWCDRTLKRWGCEVEYFEPGIGGGIAKKIRPDTKIIFIESPGSMTFEIEDAQAIAAAASKANIVTVLDNTWSGGVFHKPLALGIDVSVQANTKYASGGADVINGSLMTNREDLMARIHHSTIHSLMDDVRAGDDEDVSATTRAFLSHLNAKRAGAARDRHGKAGVRSHDIRCPRGQGRSSTRSDHCHDHGRDHERPRTAAHREGSRGRQRRPATPGMTASGGPGNGQRSRPLMVSSRHECLTSHTSVTRAPV
jgi:hypothetical protein